MNARVTTVHIPTSKMEAATAIYRDSVVAACKQQKGFRGAYLMGDPRTGRGVAITLWETEADMVAGEDSGFYREQVDKFKALFTLPPVREGYEVMVRPDAETV